jgi:hypothetical protein
VTKPGDTTRAKTVDLYGPVAGRLYGRVGADEDIGAASACSWESETPPMSSRHRRSRDALDPGQPWACEAQAVNSRMDLQTKLDAVDAWVVDEYAFRR